MIKPKPLCDVCKKPVNILVDSYHINSGWKHADCAKTVFENYELQRFQELYHRILEADAGVRLILYFGNQPYSFNVMANEIQHRTKLGRKFLDEIIAMRLI
jgi:hypothetical protein